MTIDSSEMAMHEFLTRQYLAKIFNYSKSETIGLAQVVDQAMLYPKNGEHIISHRLGYTHHGIYVGNQNVIHYSGFSEFGKNGPVEEVELSRFCGDKPYKILEHKNASYSKNDAVNRARGRLFEDNYNLAFNNCEHFVHWCFYDKNKSQQIDDLKKCVAINPIARAASILVDIEQSIAGYVRGNITKQRMLEEVSETACSASAIVYYSFLGQLTLPIPVVGSLIGSGLGYFVGQMINQSGLIALDDSRIVSHAKQRRKEIEDICGKLIPQVRQSRTDLEKHMKSYFEGRYKVLSQSFDALNHAIINRDTKAFSLALNDVNAQYDKALKFSSFDDFDSAMNSNEPFSFN